MTVRNWLVQRTEAAPRALVSAMLHALGDAADQPADRTEELCIAAAARLLDRLVSDQRYGRESALDLLAVDALTTVAYEFAAEHQASASGIADAAARGIRSLSASALARV